MYTWLLLALTFLLLVIALTATHARELRIRLPNAELVPHPCNKHVAWPNVLYRNPYGVGKKLNVFGKDYVKAKKWTKELCQKDSDGDGRTNGEELGDPKCVWTKGYIGGKVTHPGVCDPIRNRKCRRKHFRCDLGELKCDPIFSETKPVYAFNISITAYTVPPKLTTKACRITNQPRFLSNMNIVATIPHVRNRDLVQQIILVKCKKSVSLREAYECKTWPDECSEIYSMWTPDQPGECTYKDAGFDVTDSSTLIEITYSNYKLKEELDSSGLDVLLSSKRRKYQAAYFYTGLSWLDIPHGFDRVTESSVCPGECSKKIFKKSIYVTSAQSHMHIMGKEMKIELIRGNQLVRHLVDHTNFNYTKAVIYRYDDPVEIRPGDRIRTTCVYDSSMQSQHTFYGKNPVGEMCYGILTVYPKENILFQACTTWKSLSVCDFPPRHSPCWQLIHNSSSQQSQEFDSQVLENCNLRGGKCGLKCVSTVKELRQNACLKGDMFDYKAEQMMKSQNANQVRVAVALRSCDRTTNVHAVETRSGSNHAVVLSGWLAVSRAVLVLLAG